MCGGSKGLAMSFRLRTMRAIIGLIGAEYATA